MFVLKRNDIGSYLVKKGKLDEAIEWLEKAKTAPRYEPRHFPYMNLGRIYAQKGMVLRGAGRDELEARVAKGYDATVEELLHPETQPPVDHHTLLRHQPSVLLPGGVPPMGNINYMYYLVTTQRPLEEKMALFWHHVFATGNSKVDNYDQMLEQIDLFRNHGMGNYRDLLLKVAKNPSMIFWLDNNQNHGTEVNENWGRELLECALDQDDERSLKYDVDHLVVLLGFLSEKLTEEINRK